MDFWKMDFEYECWVFSFIQFISQFPTNGCLPLIHVVVKQLLLKYDWSRVHDCVHFAISSTIIFSSIKISCYVMVVLWLAVSSWPVGIICGTQILDLVCYAAHDNNVNPLPHFSLSPFKPKWCILRHRLDRKVTFSISARSDMASLRSSSCLEQSAGMTGLRPAMPQTEYLDAELHC